METNYYERLGLPLNASEEDIRKAFRNAARRLHPDVNVTAGATEMFLDIKEAYEALMDPAFRSKISGKAHQKPAAPIRTQIQYSRQTVSWLVEDQLLYALLEIEVLADQFGKTEKQTPINLALVLDTSTSMQGKRLEIIKSNAIEIIRQLKSQDILSIVTFNDRAETALPATINIDYFKAEGCIRAMQARGGTELFQGLNAGVDEVQRNLSPNYVNHVILITDGHTYGDEAKCLELAQKAANVNIGFSCFGIGHQWNDVLLDQLANTTGGNCSYVSDPTELKYFLHQKFENLSQVYAKDVTLNLVAGAGVNLIYAYRLEPEGSVLPVTSPIKLGDIPKHSQLSVLMEFLLTPIAPSLRYLLVADGNLSFTVPMMDQISLRVPLTLYRETSADNISQPPPPKIIEAMSQLTLYRMQEQVKTAIGAGNYLEATNRLKNIATNLFAQGQPDLAKTILKEAENINHHQEISSEGEKRIKYGTRALISPTINQKAVES